MSIISVGDLISYTVEGLLKSRYIKSKSVDEIESILSGMGLKLAIEKYARLKNFLSNKH